MYLNHFCLTEKPFSLTPDTQLFLNQRSHRDALKTLMLALSEGEGFLKVVGEVGTGKTLLCRILLGQLDKTRYTTAYIPNPWLSPNELKAFLGAEIGADLSASPLAHDQIAAIYRKLVQLARQGKQVVLLIDEAQAMPRETMESLRLLTNLEGEKRKLLQVVIFGQPELDALLGRKDLRQLQQRIVFSEYLKPLDDIAVRAYVEYRLRQCGRKQTLFSAFSLWLIATASGGIPRLINIIAHKALLCAYGKGDRQVIGWHVAKAVMDTRESTVLGRCICAVWQINGRWFSPKTLGVSP